jgi:plastocyanin
MKKLLVGVVAVAALAVAPAQAGSSASLVIRHQMRGCHTWSLNGNAFRASQTGHLARGTTLVVTNNDVMPHTLVKTSGPALRILQAKMSHIGARARVTFSKPGVYRLKTMAGEDYPAMGQMKTIGEDNVLRLTIYVK